MSRSFRSVWLAKTVSLDTMQVIHLLEVVSGGQRLAHSHIRAAATNHTNRDNELMPNQQPASLPTSTGENWELMVKLTQQNKTDSIKNMSKYRQRNANDEKDWVEAPPPVAVALLAEAIALTPVADARAPTRAVTQDRLLSGG